MSKKPIFDNSLTEPQSQHDLSCNWTGSADFGRLVPIQVTEMAPMEKIKARPRIEMQMLPLASPTFGKLDIYCHYFYVPTRLMWDAMDNFINQTGPLKNETPPFITPFQLANYYQAFAENKRGFYKHWTSLGLNPFFADENYAQNIAANNKKHLTLFPFRAYQQVWWDFYRDPEVLRDDVKNQYIDRGSGNFNTSVIGPTQLHPRQRSIKDCWIANLFAQSGMENSLAPISLGTDFNSNLIPDSSAQNAYGVMYSNKSKGVLNQASGGNVSTSDNSVIGQITSADIRRLEALTRLAERMSMSGKRQIEAMLARYGVKPTYEKLNMAQYVGGGKASVLVSDITASADTTNVNAANAGGAPLGAKAASGFASLSNLEIEYEATEHGYLIGILSVMPHVHFVQGLGKEWFRNSFEDWFQKAYERTGQVAVPRQEVGLFYGANGPAYATADDELTFAFCQPYYERKMGRDILAGDMMYYHGMEQPQDGDQNLKELQYIQSMSMYVDYDVSREFNLNNLLVDKYDFNKIFYYLGGSLYTDSDDHFHLCIDKDVTLYSPMDGYAVPTIETTEDPHKSQSALPQDSVL